MHKPRRAAESGAWPPADRSGPPVRHGREAGP